MEFKINSRKLGHQVTFTRPAKRYIFVDLSASQNRPGTLGRQPCYGGGLTGSTLEYWGDDKQEFAALCRKWFKAYVSSMSK